MTRKAWAVLAILLAASAGVQHFGLERQPETKAENALRNLPEVSAGDMLPTYVASLFFGAFRAVVIDVLWIQLKRAEEERRWYERRDILKMISYVQPRNPEVWTHLGWHSAYNVANGFTEPEKSWSWVRFGLTWLRQGARMLPENPHIKFELAFTLLHKPAWRDSEVDEALLKRIEGDAELQRDLRPDDVPAGGPPFSAFELAQLWLERARADIEKGGAQRYKTQMGLFIYPSSMDGYIRKAIYLRAIRAWQRGDTEKAIALARAVEKHVQGMNSRDYPEGLSSIFRDWEKFYGRLPGAIAAHARAKASGARPDELEALRALQELVTPWDSLLDEGFIWSRTDPDAPLNALKRRLSGAADEGECDDAWALAFEMMPGELRGANLEPAGLDVDWYWLRVPAPRGSGEAPPRPLKAKLRFRRPAASKAELKATLLDGQRRELKTAEIRGSGELDFEAAVYGVWGLKVEPLDPKAPLPADSRYYVEFSLAE